MITPTVGRVVWYRDADLSDQPMAALVTYVHSDTCVNLAAFRSRGAPFSVLFVELCQGDTAPSGRPYCEWMPYQKGQAAKAEALEQKLKESA